MSLKSVYLPQASIPNGPNGVIEICGDEHRHLAVGRVEAGEIIEIFDGEGQLCTARVESAGKKSTIVRVESVRVAERPAGEWILGQSLVQHAAFELILEKVVELGVTRIVPLIASRSNLRPGERSDRWKRIIVEAAKQSKRYYLPVLDVPIPFERALSMPAASKIIFAERGGGPLAPALGGSPVFYLIGPEGGWTDLELEQATDAGFKPVSLGSGILKAETAAIVASALIQFSVEGAL